MPTLDASALSPLAVKYGHMMARLSDLCAQKVARKRLLRRQLERTFARLDAS